MENSKTVEKHGSITLKNRKNLSLTGVKEVIKFNEEQINLDTNLGPLVIKGKELKINKLDVENGDVNVDGIISAIIYTGAEKSNDSIISRLFR